ncbi:hypothetical protein [Roseibium sp. MMSF_3412]|uniref:hypothetical protein n=1 Tax=unclassified Roseibium TaxID=2629323 RepID=UPI00273EBC74|nr:hypothetical protein [Roseibium sp. MMSF_3412]
MARAMTAAGEVHNPKLGGREKAAVLQDRGGVATLPFLLAKNLLFWGSISLSLYGIYTVATLF